MHARHLLFARVPDVSLIFSHRQTTWPRLGSSFQSHSDFLLVLVPVVLVLVLLVLVVVLLLFFLFLSARLTGCSVGWFLSELAGFSVSWLVSQ